MGTGVGRSMSIAVDVSQASQSGVQRQRRLPARACSPPKQRLDHTEVSICMLDARYRVACDMSSHVRRECESLHMRTSG